MVCLKGLWIYYMHFIAFVGPSIALNIILFYYGYDIYSCYFIFPSCYGNLCVMAFVGDFCSIRIINYSSRVTHYKLMLCLHTMIT